MPALLALVLQGNPLAPGPGVNYTALTALGFVLARGALLKDPLPPTASRGYDIMFTTSSGFGDAAQVPGKLPDLSLLVAQDPVLDWRGLPAQFRGAGVTYDHAVRAIPVLAAPYVMYYRRDIFERDNLSAPQTWEEFTELAERYHNGSDGLNGACIMSIGCRAESIMMRTIFGSYVQAEGPSQGLFWDAATMEPLFNSEAGEAALKIFRRLRRVGPTASDAPACLRRHFLKGECLMALDDGSLFKLANIGGPGMTGMRGKLGVAPMPGSTRVLDRRSRRLVPCDNKRCPLAQGVSQDLPVNRPIALGSILFLINGLSTLGQQLLSYTLAAALVSPAALGIDGLLLEPNELLPMRAADMDLANAPRWVKRGYDAGDVARFLVAYQATTANVNQNTDLKIRLSQNVSDVLLAASLTFLNQSTPLEALPGILKQVDAALTAIAEAQGAAAFADEYRRSLNWVDPHKASSTATGAPRPDSDSQNLGLLVGLPVALAVSALVFTVAALYWWRRGARRKTRAKALRAVTEAPGPGPDTTLVLTDIEGSTTLWDKMSDVMNLALDTHNSIVRELLGRHRGYECLTEGDSFVLAWHRSAHALAFCLDLQQALLQAQWPEELLSASEELCGHMEGSPLPITMVPARGPPSNGAMTRPWQPPGAAGGGRIKSRHHTALAAATSASGGGTVGRMPTPPASRAQLSWTSSQKQRQDSPLPPLAQQQQLQQQLKQPSQYSLEVATATVAMAGAGSSCTSAGPHCFMRDHASIATATATSTGAVGMPVRFRFTDGYGTGSAAMERQAPSTLEAVEESADGAAVGDALVTAQQAVALPGGYSEGWQQQQRLVGDRYWQPPVMLADAFSASQRPADVSGDAAATDTSGGGGHGSRTAPPLRERQAMLTLSAGPSRNLASTVIGQESLAAGSSIESEAVVGSYRNAIGGASMESEVGAGSRQQTADGSEAAAARPNVSGGRAPPPRAASSTSRPAPLLATQAPAESAASSPVDLTPGQSNKRSTSLAQAFKKLQQQQQQQLSPTARLTHQASPASPYSTGRALGQRIPSIGIALQASLLQSPAAASSVGGGMTATGSGTHSPLAYGNRMRSMTQKAVSVSTWVGVGCGAAGAADSLAAATEADVIAGARSTPAERLRFDGLPVGTVDKQAYQQQTQQQPSVFGKPSAALSFLQDDELGLASAAVGGSGGGGGGSGAATVEELLRAQWVLLRGGGSMSATTTSIANAYASTGGAAPLASMEACAEDAVLGGSEDDSEVLGRERATSPLPRRPASMAAAPARGVSGTGKATAGASGGQQPFLQSPSLRLADDPAPEARLCSVGGDVAASPSTAPGAVAAACSSRHVSGDWQAAVDRVTADPAGGNAGMPTGPPRSSLSQLQAAMASTSAAPATGVDTSGPGSSRLLSAGHPPWAAPAAGRTSARRASLDAGMAAALEQPPAAVVPASGPRASRNHAGSIWTSGIVTVTTGGGYALGAGASHLPGVTPTACAADSITGGGWASGSVTAALSRAITQHRGKGPAPPSALVVPTQDASAAGAAAPAAPAGAAAAAGGVVVFRGLRVRVGMSCGVLSEADVLRAPWKNARVQYSGLCMRLAKLVSDAAHGGMVLLSESARRALEATLVNAPEELEKVLRKHQPLLAWMGAHHLAPDLPPQQLYQLVSGALLPRLVLLSARPLRTQGVVHPLGGVLAAPVRQAAAARLSVSGVATLLAWNAEVTERALGLLHRVLLDLLRELGERVYVVEGADGWRAGGGLGMGGGGASSFQHRSYHPSDYGGPSPAQSQRSHRSQKNQPLPPLSPLAQQQLAPASGQSEGGGAAATAPVAAAVEATLQRTPNASFHGRGTNRGTGADQTASGGGDDTDDEGRTSRTLRSQAQLILNGQQDLPLQGQSQRLVRAAEPDPVAAAGACSAPLASTGVTSGRQAALVPARNVTASATANAAPRGKQPAAGRAAGKAAAQLGERQQPGVFTAVFEDPNAAATFMLRVLMVMPLLDWPVELLEHPLCEPLDLSQLAGGAGLMDGPLVDGGSAGAGAGAGRGVRRSSTAAVRRLSAAGLNVIQAAALAAGRVSTSNVRRELGMTASGHAGSPAGGITAGGAGSVHGGGARGGAPMSPSRRLMAAVRRAGSGGLTAHDERASCPVMPAADRGGMYGPLLAPKAAAEAGGAAAAQSISSGAPTAAAVTAAAPPPVVSAEGPTSTASTGLVHGLDPQPNAAAASPAPAAAVAGAGAAAAPQTIEATASRSSGSGGRMSQLGRTFFAGLRGAGAVVAGELGGVLPPPGSLGGHIVYRGKAWAVLNSLSKRGQIGQVLANASTHLRLRPDIAAAVKVVRKAE
ncbi:hypothetical protein HYH02_005847 [Chlamydomonas schloesseri]|uniref:Guanylate cyclase domain-containing protein n=1 Tax=Chlamydomonas schloesseri TaxID=2026947 RepID=A0A835WK02_9CHLO|nr:hypothetical protein HYH02_005847 [Chlamydomonas schloesseri]|eukprot:KAG2449099.1 hypothetical protein HYH02_005847 [Chlamydomonas schloesseri]